MAGGRKGKRDEKKPFKKRKADDDEITILDDNEDTNDGNEKVVMQIWYFAKKLATTNSRVWSSDHGLSCFCIRLV
jgi:hypothetical protein